MTLEEGLPPTILHAPGGPRWLSTLSTGIKAIWGHGEGWGKGWSSEIHINLVDVHCFLVHVFSKREIPSYMPCEIYRQS